jgi:hypothetical protein
MHNRQNWESELPATLSMQAFLAQRHNRANLRLRVAVGVPAEAPWNEVAHMVVETLSAQGVQVTAVEDGDETAFEHELLLLIGSGRWFPKFRELAQRLEHRRPHIILWHLQPLPPPVFTQRANALGQRLLRAQWDDLFGDWMQPLNRVVPVRGHGRSLVQRLLGVQVLQEFERIGGPEYGNISWEDLRMIFEEAAWLEETWSQPQPWIDDIATDTPTRVTFLRQHHIPARFVPLGFHPDWGQVRGQQAASPERDIDVLFVGNALSPSRVNVVPELLHRLRDWGFSTLERQTLPLGEEGVQLLRRTRVVLNVLRLPWELPGLRIFPSVACGALVVSNEAVQNEPFQAGVHFVPAPKARMAEAIAAILDHEEERIRRAELALASMNSELSLQQMLSRLLKTTASTSQTALSRAA